MYQCDRIEKVKKLHRDSFDWNAEKIPFGIWVNDERKYKEIEYGETDFDKKLFERQMMILEDTVKIGSDLVPTIGVTNYGIAAVPSVMGAEIKQSSIDVDKVEEMGFWIKKLFNDVKDVNMFKMPDKENSFIKGFFEHLKYYRDNVPKGVYIVNSIDGPFSIAEILRGSDLFLDMYDHEDEVHKLLDVCTDIIISTEKRVRKILGLPEYISETPSYFGIWCPGLRFGADSLINLSEKMIRDFVIPYYKKIVDAFKCKSYIHFCTVKEPAGQQILDAFTECDEVAAISSQLGVDLFENNYDKIKGKLAVEAGYGEGIDREIEKHGSLKKLAEHLKNDYEGSTGLILYTTVSTIDKAKRMWDEWNEVMEK